MQKIREFCAGMLCAGFALADPAGAAGTAGNESDSPALKLSGFGTIGVVHSSEHLADFTASPFKPDGPGYTHDWSADVDSRLGAQATLSVTSRLSAMLQVIAEQTFDDSYQPHIEWFNLKYEFNSDVSVRVGRIVLPSFMFSDTRKVGYALPWIRPPLDMYSLVPISSSDGLDVSYRFRWGNAVHSLLGSYGKTRTTSPGAQGGHAEARRQWAITDTVEYGSSTLFITYHAARLTVTGVKPLFDAFRQFGPQGVGLADRYDVNEKPIQFFGIGGDYDVGKWFVMGEWGWTDLRSFLGERTGWYVSAGYRLAHFTPYMTYGGVRSESATSDPGLDLASLPAFLAGPAAGLNQALNGLLASGPVQKTLSAGVRWDFLKSFDLKVQVDHTRMGEGSPGTLTNLQPGFEAGGSVTLFSVGVDFVW